MKEEEDKSMEAEFRGEWEIISFCYDPQTNRWSAISTVKVPLTKFFPEDYETMVSKVANKAGIGREVDDMETLYFSTEKGEVVKKDPDVKNAIITHFCEILDMVDEKELEKILEQYRENKDD